MLFLFGSAFAEIHFDPQSPQMQFAAAEIEAAMAARGEQATVILSVDPTASLKAEGFEIKKTGKDVTVVAKVCLPMCMVIFLLISQSSAISVR